MEVAMREAHNTTPGAKVTISGVLEAFFETGTEGVIWSLYEDNKQGYDGLHPLKNGDHLRILGENDAVIWEGLIDLEYETGYRSFPNNPEYGQQECWGFWVHGNQRGFAISDWGELFMCPWIEGSKYKGPLRAELVKA
jgi:hypothetical protein